jgi:molybdate transport system ATP-binding protein
MTSELIVDFEKRYPAGATVAASLRQPADRFSLTVLFGPSGCGKTTVLRALAGLERPERGTITFAGETWLDADANVNRTPQSRDVGFLFQDYALFPHRTVAANVGFGLRAMSSEDRRRRVSELLSSFELAGLEHRYPHELSGGQRQRTALARALARRPRLLLLDEPLSALDAGLRDQLRGRLRRQLAEFGVPTVVVTHDRVEAIALADQVVVMQQGRVLQAGSVEQIFSHPRDLATARIVGVETVVPGEIVSVRDGLAEVRVGGATLTAVAPDVAVRSVYVCLKGEDVVVQRTATQGSSVRNQLSAVVRALTPEGPLVRVALDCGFELTALVTRPACEELQLQPGDRVTALFKAPAIHLIPKE